MIFSKKTCNFIQIGIAILAFLVWVCGARSDFLMPLLGIDTHFNVYLSFGLLMWGSVIFNLICWRFGIWFSLLAAINYMPLIAYQIFVAKNLKPLTEISIFLSIILFLFSAANFVIYLFYKKQKNEHSPKLDKLRAKKIVLRNKLKSFRFGNFINNLIIYSGVGAFIFSITTILLALAATQSFNFIENNYIQVYWKGIIFFFMILSWLAYAKLTYKALKTGLVIRVISILILIKFITTFLQAAQIQGLTEIFYTFLNLNLILAFILLIIEAIAWVGGLLILYRYRMELLLPEYPEKMVWKGCQKTIFWLVQALFMLIFVSQWIVTESMPSSKNLFTSFQNAPIVYSADNTIVIKNVKFNQTS